MSVGDSNPIAPSTLAPWTLALQLVGATAGLGALTTFVGGALLWIRFEALDLPADQAVNLLPKQLLLVVGAHSLVGPICLALLVALAWLVIRPYRGGHPSHPAYPAVLFVILLLAASACAIAVRGYDIGVQALMALALAVGIAAVFTVASAAAGRFQMAWTLFGVFVLCGAVLAVVRTLAAPQMEPVAVTLTSNAQGVGGFYIGQTADRLYIAPLPGSGDPGDPFADADIDRIVEIDRDQVEQMAFRKPTGVESDEAGREQAQSLLEDLRVATAGGRLPAADEVITTADPITAFAPLVHLHSRERLWPMSADAFLRNAVLVWAHDGGCPSFNPASGEHAKDPSQGGTLLGRFDQARLAGPRAYAHVAADADCKDAAGAPIPAGAHTRPFDLAGRSPRLPAKEGFALDLANAKRVGTKTVVRDGAQAIFKGVPAYYERTSEQADGKPALRITYWFFYGLSQPPGAPAGTRFVVHEGDWERLSVLLAHGEGADDYRPLSVRYHAHDGSRDVTWSAVKRVGTGGSEPSTHPVAFSAVGSHASYWRAGSYENVFSAGGRRRFAVHDSAIACPDCPQWRTWELQLDARAQPWYGFGGAWGAVGGMMGTTGPLGPSPYKTQGLSPAPEETVRRAPVPIAPAAVPARAASTATASP